MKKRKVRILQSIAGIGDPDKSRLDQKYAGKIEAMRKQKFPDRAIEAAIAEDKRLDRYDAPPTGFKSDWSFKPNEETLIDVELASKWEESGICVFADEKKGVAA